MALGKVSDLEFIIWVSKISPERVFSHAGLAV